MKRVFAILLFLFAFLTLRGEEPRQVAVFVYCGGNVDTPINALRAKLTNELLNSGGGSYVVLDRTDEILSALKSEYRYQAGGMVRDADLVTIGDHLGAHYLCVVSITRYQDGDQYFFECRLVNVGTRQIELQSFYPMDDKSTVSSLSPQEQIRVAGALSSIFRLRKGALKVGAPYCDDSGSPVYVNGSLMRIGYIDETGEHGFSYVILPRKYDYPPSAGSDSLSLRPPYLSEMRLLYGNNDVLGLNGEFWSLDFFGEVDHSPDFWLGSFDFSSGREFRRKSSRKPIVKGDGRVVNEFRSVTQSKIDVYGRITHEARIPSEASLLYCINIHLF